MEARTAFQRHPASASFCGPRSIHLYTVQGKVGVCSGATRNLLGFGERVAGEVPPRPTRWDWWPEDKGSLRTLSPGPLASCCLFGIELLDVFWVKGFSEGPKEV